MHSGVYIPDEFINHIKAILPSHLQMDDFIQCCRTPLRKSIRVNTLKISVPDFLQRVSSYNWQLTPIPWCREGFWLQRPEEQEQKLPLGNTAEHMAGLFYIQEASSMMPPTALFSELGPVDTVLDMTAAPGSKSTQIAAKMQNHGLLVANELSASRIKALSANIQRCGVANTAITLFDGNVFGKWLPETFDAILLDAPCSGEGGVRKDEDAMKNWSLEHINNIADIQKQLIESAFIALKPGGTMVYSTCTLNQEENQQVCEHLKHTYGDAVEFIPLDDLFEQAADCVTAEGYLHVWPQVFDSEGFFVAKIKKLASVAFDPAPTKHGKYPFVPATRKDKANLEQFLQQEYGILLPQDKEVYQRDNEYWLFPQQYPALAKRMRFQRGGVKIAELHRKGFRLTHEFALAFGYLAKHNCYQLSQGELVQFYKGQDISVQKPLEAGENLLFFQGSVVGLGKVIKQKIKNGLPRELVRDNRLITWE